MSVFTDTWRFLLQRRLWPVAIILVGAAVAVPMLLGSEPTVAPAPPAAAVKSDRASVLATEPIVAPVADADRSGRREVLGSAKDPFKPKATPTPQPTPTGLPDPNAGNAPAATTPGATGPGGTTVGGSPAAPVTGTPVVPGVTTPITPKKHYSLFELTVRFGLSDGSTPPRHDVKRLEALPSADQPVLIYLGVLDDKKTAVFLVDSGVIAQGDGTCLPSRTTCETIHIKEGETEFFDVAPDAATDGATDGASAGSAAQYELDVLKIRKTKTTSAKKAARSLARVSKAGRKIVRARIAGDGPLRYSYDKHTGRLHKLSHKAYKAVVAKAAHAARASF